MTGGTMPSSDPAFSANLGFLWTDLALPDAVAAAAGAGFAAVEVHWPYATPPQTLRAACTRSGAPLISLNTLRGGPGEFGLSALPGREAEARAAIDQALGYAIAAGAGAVHVMAGVASGPAATRAFRAALVHACTAALPHGLTILIEPINPHDVPGYHLADPDTASALIDDLGQSNLKLMLDLYHMGRMGRDPAGEIATRARHLGHVQIAGVPERGPPRRGTLDIAGVRAALRRVGWTAPLGAEYRPQGPTGESLDWMDDWRGDAGTHAR
jgi:2-dehydrotetronate isomerase